MTKKQYIDLVQHKYQFILLGQIEYLDVHIL
jgi:hypothetical protein